MKIKFLIVLLCYYTQIFSQAAMEFVENKGQWNSAINFKAEITNGAFALQKTGYRVLQHDANDLRKILDYMHGTNPNKSSSNLKINAYEEESIILHSNVFEVKFLNANENSTVVAEKPLDSYNNYFIGNDNTKWAGNCKIYTTITYKNVYDGIDVRYYTSNGTLKYDFIVHPGADASKIILYYEGVQNLKSKNNDLIIKTALQELKETAPYSYQFNTKEKKKVNCRFDVKGNFVRFKIDDNIDKNSTLIIDPILIFCTFTGSTGNNWGYTATYDGSGNFYAGGINLQSGFPISNGAFQSNFAGGVNLGEGAGFDMSIIKFNATGTNRIYASYLGGANSNEQPHSLIVDANDNLVIAGRTASADYPTTLPNYGACGNWDIILTKLNATGTALINSIKIGGTANDGVNVNPKYASPSGALSIRRNYGDDARSEVILDNAGNVYLASCTQSAPDNNGNGGFPTTAGAAQTVKGASTAARYQDGVVLKLSSNLSTVLFSTLLGGNGDDAAYVLAIHPFNNNIYVAGATESTDLLGDKTGVLFPTNQGGLENMDGFVTLLKNDGSQFIKTTYMGTNGIDIVFGVQCDKNGYPYVMGTTTGAWPVINAPYSQIGGKQFIAKLKEDLTGWEYSTKFGTNTANPNISPFAFLVDRCGNIYVSGWGGELNNNAGYFNNQTTVGLPTTAGCIQPTTDGSDMYFLVMEKNANSLLYGTFYGQVGGTAEHVDGGTSRFDKNGIIYQSVCANCYGGATFPTHPPNVWSPNNPAGTNGCNLAAIKISLDFAGVGSYVQSSVNGVKDTSGCVPFAVSFRDTIANATKYIWDFGDGSPLLNTTVPNTSHTYNAVGDYRVKLVSIDSNSCNIADTSSLLLRVRNDDALLGFTPIKLAPCSALAYNFINTSTPPASKPFKANSFRWNFGDGTGTVIAGTQTVTHSYATAGNYKVTLALIDTNYCNEPDSISQNIRVAPLVTAKIKSDSSGCVPFTTTFTNNSIAGTDFIWDFGDGSSIATDVNPVHTYSVAGTYKIKLIAIDTGTCNKVDSTFFTIVISPIPKSNFTYSPNPPQVNISTTFTNNSTNATFYKWIFGDGDSTITSNINTTITHTYNATQVFTACLIATNQYKCTDTSCTNIAARVFPLFDVPNAFTPNNDGINDVLYVGGFGIKTMNWVIYNRWGTVMFSTTDRKKGWDGYYAGKLQPQDVYNYVLDLEFFDGKKERKTGDITLLR